MFTKRIIQTAISIAIIAFILSTSRIFLSVGERTGESDFYIYNLTQRGPMAAFISIIILSVLAIILGIWLIKKYDIIGHPLLYSGIITLTFITLINYIYLSYSDYRDDSTSNIILFLVFLFEATALITYAELKMPNIVKTKTPPPNISTLESKTISPTEVKEDSSQPSDKQV